MCLNSSRARERVGLVPAKDEVRYRVYPRVLAGADITVLDKPVTKPIEIKEIDAESFDRVNASAVNIFKAAIEYVISMPFNERLTERFSG